jgi:parallel beta-helix repeat protein
MKKHYNYFLIFLTLYLIPFTILSQEYTLQEVGQFGGWDSAGVETSGMAVYEDYLYSIDNSDLAIYDIGTDPASPVLLNTITVPHGNKVFSSSSWATLAVTTEDGGTHGFYIYDLSDPLNPIARPHAITPDPILDFVFNGGTFADIIEQDVDSLFVYYLGSSTTTPYKVDAYSLPGNGTCLGLDPWANTLFVGYENGFRVYNTSNPYNYIQQFEQSLSTALPQRIAPLTPITKIFVGLNDSGGSSISCYSYDDPTNPQLVQQQVVSADYELWDMKWEFSEAFLIVSLNEGQDLETYLWDDDAGLFSYGPSLFMDAPADIIPYFHFNATQNGIKSKREVRGSGDDYIYVTNGSVGNVYMGGYEQTKIVKVIPPGSGQVMLTMNINPPEAADNGCSTTPSPGQYQYDVGSELNLYAIPNEADGWYFTGWSGSASGTDLIYHIVMDANKNVTANFAKLELTVSGHVGPEVYCPDDGHDLGLPFLVCASEVDDWNLEKISFRTSGSGDDKNDFMVLLYRGGNELIWSGTYDEDNGTIDIPFSPPITIDAGDCVHFDLIYHFIFDPDHYAYGEMKSFKVETFGVSAEPVNYTGGIISGKAEDDSLTFARIITSGGIPFPYIGAVDNSYYVQDGDTCYVCAGHYEESSVLLSPENSYSIVSMHGNDQTSIEKNGSNNFLFLISGAPKNIIGFTISRSPSHKNMEEDESMGICILHADNCNINDNVITGFDEGICVSNARHTIIKDNKFDNSFEQSIDISLHDVDSSEINGNAFVDYGYIQLYNSNHNDILQNNIDNAVEDFLEISLSHSNFNHVYDNKLLNANTGSVILLVDSSNYNKFDNNENFRFDIKSSEYNTLYKNLTLHIELNNAFSSDINHNLIHNNPKESGIQVYFSELGSPITIRNNVIRNNHVAGISGYGNLLIKNNDIYQNRSTGISLIGDGSGARIRNNKIHENGANGISIATQSNVEIIKNNITDNKKKGLYIQYSNKVSAINNNLTGNCRGIKVENSHQIYLKNNYIWDSFCFSTGIEVTNSSPFIWNNIIANNNGGGIMCEDNSAISLSSNNILGNQNYGLNNTDANVTIVADGNYWGNSGGPGASDIMGNVTVDDWLTDPVSLIAFVNKDTIYVPAGKNDSTSLFIQNLIDPGDKVNITIADDKGWIEPVNGVEEDLAGDSTGLAWKIRYEVPADSNIGEISAVTYHVESVGKYANTVDGTFYIATYLPAVSEIQIFPDSTTTAYGDTVQFIVIAYDQYQNQIDFSPVWSANHGNVSGSGLFTSDDYEGKIEITATDTVRGATVQGFIYNTNQTLELTQLTITPATVVIETDNVVSFEAKGWNQFNYPYDFEEVWTATGGIITASGIYTADDTPGNYTVSVSDAAGAVVANADIIIAIPNAIEEVVIPPSYVLHQNYPNPFKTSTTISYSIPQRDFVQLKVYNIFGRVVAVLVSKEQPGGNYQVVFNASGLTSGIYFCRLQSGNFTESKKLIIE